MTNRATIDRPQVSASRYRDRYENSKRWSSYWLQIDGVLSHSSGHVLEIGVGTGAVANYLRGVAGRDVTTVDIDPMLKPDVVADIVRLPFEDKAFGCVMACEVLEHIPFEEVPDALRELRRVADKAVISVPNSGFYLQFVLALLFGQKRKRFELPWLFRRRKVREEQEHFWELEVQGYPLASFVAAMEDAGWKIRSSVRNPDHLFHHFFIAE